MWYLASVCWLCKYSFDICCFKAVAFTAKRNWSQLCLYYISVIYVEHCLQIYEGACVLMCGRCTTTSLTCTSWLTWCAAVNCSTEFWSTSHSRSVKRVPFSKCSPRPSTRCTQREWVVIVQCRRLSPHAMQSACMSLEAFVAYVDMTYIHTPV